MRTAVVSATRFSRIRGQRRYELSNHLGNVMAVVSDRKVVKAVGTDISYYADVVSSTDYYAFGMVMADRSWNTEGYRFGFNGKENDNEVKGTGNQQDYGMRIYDARLGRFLSVDPISEYYPDLTPYQFASNSPIGMIDLDGLEGVKPKYSPFKIPVVINAIANNQKFIDHQRKALGMKLSARDIGYITSYESLTLTMYDLDGSTKYPGNATIGFGTLIHYGLIGSTTYDKMALEKEKPFLRGITEEQAANLFIDEIFEKERYVNKYIKDLGVENLVNDAQFFALVDLAFNKGQGRALEVLKTLKQKGLDAAYQKILHMNDDSEGLRKRRYFNAMVFKEGRRLLENDAAIEMKTGKIRPSNTLPDAGTGGNFPSSSPLKLDFKFNFVPIQRDVLRSSSSRVTPKPVSPRHFPKTIPRA